MIPGAGDPDVAIVGDLNSYAGEDPIAALESAGYTNLVKEFHGDEAYSYVFDGQWGYLDYVMASSSLLPQVTGVADVHHNADEPSVLDFNTEFKTPGQIASLYAPDRFRTSDHDPVLAGLDLIGPVETTTVVTSSANPSTIGGPVQFTATVTGAPTGGTVQFEVDGEPLGGPVDVVDGLAVSPSTSTLSLGSHAVTADYSGSESNLPSSGALTQLVQVGVKVLLPTAGARIPGRIVPIAFQLTGANGKPIPDSSAQQLFAERRVTVSASGAQSLAPSRPVYDPFFTNAALYAWKTAQRPNGAVTISISITYPQAPTQVVTIPIVLT